MSFRLAFRYISYRKLHDRKLPNVLARFTNQDPEYIRTSSPRKADHCSKTILKSIDSETIDSETMLMQKKNLNVVEKDSIINRKVRYVSL